jgi:hypothetical protein
MRVRLVIVGSRTPLPSRGRFYAVSLSWTIVLARCHIVAVNQRPDG